MDVEALLLSHSELFSTSQNVMLGFLRQLLWGAISGLSWCIDAFEEAIHTILANLNFFENPQVQEWFGGAQTIAWALLAVGVVLMGFQLLLNRSREKSQIPINILLTLLILVGMPTLSSTLADLTGTATTLFMTGSGNSVSEQVAAEMVNDSEYLAQSGWSDTAFQNKNYFNANSTESEIFKIDVTELVWPEKSSAYEQYYEVFGYHLESDPVSGVTTATQENFDTSSSLVIGRTFSDCYYRYQVEWFPLLLMEFGLLICMVFTAVKVAKIIFQIVYNLFFTVLVAPVDLSSGQRLKKCVEEFFYLYLTLIAIALMYRIYLLGVGWATSTFSGLTEGIVLIGMSWSLLDGPNIVQKLFGIDAGLSSIAHGMQTIYYGTNMLQKAGHALGKAVGTVGKAAATAGAYGAGALGASLRGGHDSGQPYDLTHDPNLNSAQPLGENRQNQLPGESRYGVPSGENPNDGNPDSNAPNGEDGQSRQGRQDSPGMDTARDTPGTDSMNPAPDSASGGAAAPDETSRQRADRQSAAEQAIYQGAGAGGADSGVNSTGSYPQAPSGRQTAPGEERTLSQVIAGSTQYGSRRSTAQDGRFAFIRRAYDIGRNTGQAGVNSSVYRHLNQTIRDFNDVAWQHNPEHNPNNQRRPRR